MNLTCDIYDHSDSSKLTVIISKDNKPVGQYTIDNVKSKYSIDEIKQCMISKYLEQCFDSFFEKTIFKTREGFRKAQREWSLERGASPIVDLAEYIEKEDE